MTADTRAVSPVVAVVLLFSIVIAGMVVTVAIGATAFDQTKDELGAGRAEKTLTQFDSKAAIVALGQTDRQTVPLARGDAADYHVRPDSGWMNVTIENTTSGDTATVANATLGAVVYENDQATIAYQGGGVWKDTDAGATMVSPPEFHWRNATLTLPIIALGGEAGIGERAQVTRNGTTRKRYPNATLDGNFTNPLERGRVTVTVESEYYQAWGQYFEQRTDGDVEYDHDAEQATITLKTPIGKRKIQNGMSALSSSGSFTISGTSGSACTPSRDAYTDSYDSADGSYCDQLQGTNGNLTYGGSIDVAGTGAASIKGKVVSDDISFSGNALVHGDINYISDCEDCASHQAPGYEIEKINDIDTVGNIDSVITSKVDSVEDDNDNGDTGAISGDRLDFGGNSQATLDAGTYYLDRIELTGSDTVELDTSSGDVTLVVDEFVDVGENEIEVSGNNRSRIYVNGSEKVDDEWTLNLGRGGEMLTPDDNATQLWVYGKGSFNASIGDTGGGMADPAEFNGAIYAPVGKFGNGEVIVQKGHVFGGIVTGDTELATQASIHYDEALGRELAVNPNAKVVKVTYLHISVNHINVTSS